MPSAKLLSKEEQAIPADSSLLESVKGSAKAMQGILSAMSLGLLATLLFLSRELQAILASQATSRASKRPFCSKSRIDRSVTAFFFRPPPILS
jgi:predicted thioredoxin/glutaredoxin